MRRTTPFITLPFRRGFLSFKGNQMLINLGYGLSGGGAQLVQRLPGNSVIALFGDSLESHNGYGNATASTEEYSNWSRGYFNWCRMLDPRGKWDNWYDPSKARLYQGQNQGISGNNTTQMVARKAEIYNITGVKVVVQGGGTNDIQQDVSAATIIANHANCIAEWKSRGIKTILLTPPARPTSGTDS